ncbi:cupin domain-containing protein [Clostridium sp.]|uniref:cupin domain-containing protein n=1 Tax=Clostridium sp. TaxID=1506 RepID=UPI001B5C144D|nr:cupin domain-containing protein [Clostridium sp.]MBP3916963.1 cupin domain-containing protein [Clostridium sp.]
MNKFDVISSEVIDRAFITEQRQYLTGDLKMPQILDFIKDENVEIGMSRYKEYKIEQPHYHTDLAEYHLILKGETKYVNVTEDKEYVFKKGDFYIIRPNTIYIQKSLPGTELIFIKVPGINDKVPCESTDRINKWFEEWDNIW